MPQQQRKHNHHQTRRHPRNHHHGRSIPWMMGVLLLLLLVGIMAYLGVNFVLHQSIIPSDTTNNNNNDAADVPVLHRTVSPTLLPPQPSSPSPQLQPPPPPQYQLCPHSNDNTHCPIQTHQPCQFFQSYTHSISFRMGIISTIPESNMTLTDLSYFCKMGQLLLLHRDSNLVLTSCRRRIESTIYILPNYNNNNSNSNNNSIYPITLLPGFGAYWPGADEDSQYWFSFYSTAILVNSTVCFWPYIPKLNETEQDSSLWTRPRNNSVSSHLPHLQQQQPSLSPRYYKRVIISEGFFDNFWHAAAVLDNWCKLRNDHDLYFVVQTEDLNPPPFLESWSSALGISQQRIIVQDDRPIVVTDLLLASQYRDIYADWSCLHGVLGQPPDLDEGEHYALLYVREMLEPERDIPYEILVDFKQALVTQIPGLKVKAYNGYESFDQLRKLFANAKIVIGPHGAGLANVILCQELTPVVELITFDLGDRPWQMYGGHSFHLSWWPVMLGSFDSHDDIMKAVAVVQKALEQAEAAKATAARR